MRPGATAAPRICAAVSGLAFLAILWLEWFGARPAEPEAGDAGSGILNLLNTYALDGSGWEGLNAIPIAFVLVGAVAIAAGRGLPALVVALIGVVALSWNLVDLNDQVRLRWPAYVGVALAADLLVCAAWAWRAARLESPVA